MRVAELRPAAAEGGQRLGEGVLRGDGGPRPAQHAAAGIHPVERGRLGAVLHRGADQVLPQRAERRPVVSQPGEFEGVGAGVVVAVGVGRRGHGQPHRIAGQPGQLPQRRSLDDARRAAAVTLRQRRRVVDDLAEATFERLGETGDEALVHAAAQIPPAARVPAQVLPVLARVARLLQHAHAGDVEDRAQALVLDPGQEGPGPGDGLLGPGGEGALGDGDVGEAKRRVHAPRAAARDRAQQPVGVLGDGSGGHAVRDPRHRPGNAGADGHDLDAEGASPRAAGDEDGRADARERVQHRAAGGAQRARGEVRREPLLVSEPAQPGPRLVPLPGHQPAAVVGAHDEAIGEAPAQGLARRASPARFRVRSLPAPLRGGLRGRHSTASVRAMALPGATRNADRRPF